MGIQELLSKFFLFNLFDLARFSHAKKYLFKRVTRGIDPYSAFVLSKNRERPLCIWAIQQIKHRKQHVTDDLYVWELGGEKWVANLDHIHGLYEYLQGSFHEFYRCECQNKTVLDIGGYIGDSARYFLKQGAAKVIIYEPCLKNVDCMRHNLKEHAEVVKIIPKGVSEHCGAMTIHSNYPEGHIGFGNREGRYQLNVEGESFHSILSNHQVDVAKVDCEGYEKYLLEVENGLLRRIPYWMIELHDGMTTDMITQKFLSAGFEKIPIAVPEEHQGISHFRLVQ